MRFQLLEEGIKRAMLQVASDIWQAPYALDCLGCDDRELARLPQKGQGQGLTMMAVAMFANVTAAGRREAVVGELYGNGIGAVIPHDFRGDLRARPDRGKE